MDFDLKFWAGTDEALAVYLAVMRSILMGDINPDKVGAQGKHAFAENDPNEVERQSRLLTKTGDLAIIKIAGPLNNTDSWINEYRGMTGYPEIRTALVQVATDPEIQGVILDINSGGGSVSGVFDTAKLIQQVDKIKPVHAFSDGQVASAAYLLGVSARTLSIGRMTEAGSVGVLTVHQEISRLLKEAGVTPTVMRAGKYKAMGNPYEPLSEAAQAEIQGQLDYMYQVFVEHVADRRKVSYDVADKKLAQGRVFIGDRAQEIGLVDFVTTFDAVASKLQGGIDAKKPGSKYASNLTQGKLVAEKKPLTEQEVAALALGAGASAEHGGGSGGAPEDAAAAAAAAASEKEAADKAAAEKEAADKGAAPAAKGDSEIVAFLKGEIVAKDEKIVAQAGELSTLKAKADGMEATHKGLRAIAETSVGYLRVALGSSGAKVEDMTDASLLAEQASLQKAFETKFKAGGVASVSTGTPEKKGDAAANNPLRKARLEATRPQK